MSFLATTYSSSNQGKFQPHAPGTTKSAKPRSVAKKRSTSIGNNSFQLNLSSKIFKNSRSVSRDRTRNLSLSNMTPSNRRSASIQIYGTSSLGKLINGYTGVKELKVTQENRLKKELVKSLVKHAREEAKTGDFESALKTIEKILKTHPDHMKALYLRSNCYISMKKFREAIPDLLSIIQENPKYDKNIYIALAVCFVDLEEFPTAIRQLSKCLEIFPKFADGFINRGMLYNRQQRWDKAINDFHDAISINPTRGNAYLGLADTLIGIGDNVNAMKMLKKAGKDPASHAPALLKSGKIFFEQQQFQHALHDLDQALALQHDNVEAIYYRAFALLGLNNIVDAGLCLEQVIKYDVNKKFTGPAIYNLGAIKIKQRDYYGAMFTFQRGVDQGLEIEEQKILKNYVEAILSLIKRKFKEGVNMLSKIIRSKNPLIQEYIGNCFAYRGYGFASLEKHEKAVKDLTRASTLQKLDKSSEFNHNISKAALLSEKDPQAALELFSQAGIFFPTNIEPMIYSAAIHFQLAISLKRQSAAEKSKDLLDAAIKIRDSESDLFFFRGIVLYFLNQTIEAVHDIEKAIDKAEDNVVDHFIARGLCSCRLKMYKEAIQDFCIAIQLNERCAEAYYYRGRCNFILDNTAAAFEDFQKLATLKPNDPEVHIHAGDLLMLTGSIEDALKAYLNAGVSQKSPESFKQRAKCFLLTDRIEEAIGELKKISKITASPQVNYDLEVLEILNNAYNKEGLKANLANTIGHLTRILSYKHEGDVCNALHVHWYKGVFMFFIGDFQKSKSEFKKAICNKDESDDETIEKDNIELLYNISVIYIVGEFHEAALEHLKEIVYYLEGKDRGKVLLLMGILNFALHQQKEAKTLITEGYKYDPETIQMYLDGKSEIKILPLEASSKYASSFPMAKVKIGDCQPVLLRPSFSLPKVDLPRMEFSSEKFLLNKFCVKTVKCKPETPWLNRIKGSIQFTDEIQNLDHDSIDSSKSEIKIQASESNYSDATMRKYKSESISMGEDEENTINIGNSSESSIEGMLADIDDIEFY